MIAFHRSPGLCSLFFHSLFFLLFRLNSFLVLACPIFNFTHSFSDWLNLLLNPSNESFVSGIVLHSSNFLFGLFLGFLPLYWYFIFHTSFSWLSLHLPFNLWTSLRWLIQSLCLVQLLSVSRSLSWLISFSWMGHTFLFLYAFWVFVGK